MGVVWPPDALKLDVCELVVVSELTVVVELAGVTPGRSPADVAAGGIKVNYNPAGRLRRWTHHTTLLEEL